MVVKRECGREIDVLGAIYVFVNNIVIITRLQLLPTNVAQSVFFFLYNRVGHTGLAFVIAFEYTLIL